MERGQKVWWVRLSLITGAGFLLRLVFVLSATRYDLPLGDQHHLVGLRRRREVSFASE